MVAQHITAKYSPVALARITAGFLIFVLNLSAAVPAPLFTPTDTDCIKWVQVSDGKLPDMSSDLLMIGHQKPCGSDDGSTWGELLCMTLDGQHAGHLDVNDGITGYTTGCVDTDSTCIYWAPDGGSDSSNSFYLATLANTNLSWTKYSRGAKVPTNAYKVGGLLVARGLPDSSRHCPLTGNDCQINEMPGYVKPTSTNTLGPIQFEDYGKFSENSFALATCHPPTQSRYLCSNATHTCVETQHNDSSTFPTQQDCATVCNAPPPPKPPPPPPPVLHKPCIRIGHAAPTSAGPIDLEIVQTTPPNGNKFKWSGLNYTTFTNWTGVFDPGEGTVNIYKAGATTPMLTVEQVPLTPGPIDVIIKCPQVPIGMKPADVYCWPPSNIKRDQQIGVYIEAVAASYHIDAVPRTSFVRMVNLSPNAYGAGLRANGTALFNYTLETGVSSQWRPLPAEQTTFEATAYDAKGDEDIASIGLTPPLAPASMTMWLLGQVDDDTFPPQLVAKIDAPPPEAGVGTFCS